MEPSAIIDKLGMAPHPEGGWYVETYRPATADGARGPVTAIYFLLEAGQRSHWHRVDAVEIWLWHAGSPLALEIAVAGENVTTMHLGPDIMADQSLQAVVPKDAWQAARSTGSWTLVSCVVAPAFNFAGFTLAPPSWSPGKTGERAGWSPSDAVATQGD